MNRSILFRVDTPEPARLWSGLADLYLPADDVEPEDGALYLGGGELISGIDDVEQLLNGTADRVEVVISGVTAVTVGLAIEHADETKGARVDIGVVEFDAAWQVIEVSWEAQYRIDKLLIGRDAGTRVITLSMGSDDTGRSRSVNAYWTAADQRRRSPDDAFFDFVASINAGTSRAFGPSE